MAEYIKEIGNLPLSDQERILQQMEDCSIPIEIDNVIYMIPDEVNQLIESLSNQIREMRHAIKKN